ncbi:MAG: A/G-specific adenine glycosylase [Planctomycetes bacterium]|nr:A/G-specific adenine glycosylase [Planctomycetota bacterium]
MDPASLHAALLPWFEAVARPLPWRATRDPYRVWVSEVMLQQTQVDTVLRYYDRFLARFPTVEALAAAPDEDVRALWSGLGFYRRARNLHAAARRVVAEHGGVVPRDPAALGALPGLGRYTVGAVLSIAHDAPLPLVDGNVARVLARLFRVPGDPTAGPALRRLWSLAEGLVPRRRAGDWNQALMELGATVCRPTSPRCDGCPLAAGCEARAAGEVERFPEPRRRAKVVAQRRAAVCLVRPDGAFLIARRPDDGLLAGLWELPAVDLGPKERPATAARRLARALGAGDARLVRVGRAEHQFTHRHWTVDVFRGEAAVEASEGRWVTPADLGALGVPTAAKKVLQAAGVLGLSPSRAAAAPARRR